MTDVVLVPAVTKSARARLWTTVPFALASVVPVTVLVLWQIAATRHWMSPQILPTPTAVWETARDLASDDLLRHLAISARRLLAGLALGTLVGAALGLAMGLSRRVEAAVLPTFLALVQIPTLAWIPLLMLLAGLGETLKIIVIVKAVIVPVTLQTHLGIRDTDARLNEAARILRLGRLARLRYLLLPSALPAFLTGFRLGLAHAWTSLVAVELLASSEGIGYLLVWGRQLFQLDVVFVCVAVIAATGLAMDRVGQIADNQLRWPRPTVSASPAGGSGSPVIAFILPAALILIWHFAVASGALDPRTVRAPLAIFQSLTEGLADGSLVAPMLSSLRRCLTGLAVGAGGGFVVGLVMGQVPVANILLSGTLTALRLVALFAWIPLLTAWAGIEDGAIITFIALATFFPMQLATMRGVAGVAPQLDEAACILRLTPLQRLRFLVLPGAAPSIFAGLRLAMVVSWVASMGAEYFLIGDGIGSLMIKAEQIFRTETVMAAMVLVGTVAALIGAVGDRVEQWATRWRTA